MSTFRDWIPEEETTGSEGSGFTDFVPDKEVKKEVETKKVPKKDLKLTDDDIADLGIDKAKLKALEEEQS